MKYENVQQCISFGLLRFVRDAQPSEVELLQWLGEANHGRYHVLRKAGLLAVEAGKVVLSPQYLSADGQSFRYRHALYLLDEEVIHTFRTEETDTAKQVN